MKLKMRKKKEVLRKKFISCIYRKKKITNTKRRIDTENNEIISKSLV